VAKILIIVGHPRNDTYSDALADAYRDGALEAGHEVDLFRAAELTFDPILHDGYERLQPREPDLEAVYRSMIAADHITVIFPIWMGTMPALLKGLLERLLQPELVAEGKAGKFPEPLKGKSVRLVTTSGMPGFLYRWWFGAPAIKILHNNIFGFLGAGPVRSTVHGGIESVSDDTRKRWLDEMRGFGQRAR
jgi:NAD(P)H dehydrogenase (quinone)